jgi:hypothetical protein
MVDQMFRFNFVAALHLNTFLSHRRLFVWSFPMLKRQDGWLGD